VGCLGIDSGRNYIFILRQSNELFKRIRFILILSHKLIDKICRGPDGGTVRAAHLLIPLSISITDMAKILGVSRKTASKIVNERGTITPDMALRLSRAFDTTPDLWLGLQMEYDLWHVIYDSKEWQRVKSVEEFVDATAQI
jgi:addiction module HigA family antidote